MADMSVVMVSNYLNHHVVSLTDELFRLSNGNFRFIATKEMGQFRRELGYDDLDHKVSYVIRAYEGNKEKKLSIQLCKRAEVLIVGDIDRAFRLPKRGADQITFVYSERLFKDSICSIKTVGRYFKYLFQAPHFKNYYLLCASGYAAKDYAVTLNFINKAFKWGYFPTFEKCDIKTLTEKKKNAIPHLLWVGRLIDWKHPEIAIEIAEYLISKGYDFRMTIIGGGPLISSLSTIAEKKMNEKVEFIGSIPAKEVRHYMEKANIFLFTSDRHEGWGAVLNEAMGCGCAVLASREAGATPYLINKTNGCSIDIKKKADLFKKCEYLVANPEYALKLGLSAYKTIEAVWNGECAANRLIQLSNELKAGNKKYYISGPCSLDKI